MLCFTISFNPQNSSMRQVFLGKEMDSEKLSDLASLTPSDLTQV